MPAAPTQPSPSCAPARSFSTLHAAGPTSVGQPVELTGAEFRVLWRLVRDAGRLVSRADLTEEALGRKLTLYDRAIDTHVSNLRRKLERATTALRAGSAGPDLEGGSVALEIRSVRGAGYELLTETPP